MKIKPQQTYTINTPEIYQKSFNFSQNSNMKQGQLQISKKTQSKDIGKSFNNILSRIKNIQHQFQADKIDDFLNKTMFLVEQKQNQKIRPQKKQVKCLTFGFQKNSNRKKKIKTNTFINFKDNPKLQFQSIKCLEDSQKQLKEFQLKKDFGCKSMTTLCSKNIQSQDIISLKKQPQFCPSLKISDFEIGPQIGSGKFGDVYLCKHKQSQWIFALKKIMKSTIKQYKMQDQFINQLKIQYKLDHPNIVKLYAHFDDQYHIFLIMEFATGGNAMKYLKCGQKQTANILEQMLHAIKHTHTNYIIHRDIKPQNIVIFFETTFKLCDFGLSAFVSPHFQNRTSFCGTLDYIAPQMKNQGIYSYYVDIWGLGVLGYQLLKGEAPFKEQITNWKKRGGRRTSSWNWKIIYPSDFSGKAVNFLKNLLKQKPMERATIENCLQSQFIKLRKEHEIKYFDFDLFIY